MFCENCGKEINDNDVFCPNCGKEMQEEKISNSLEVKNENLNTEPKKKKSRKGIAMLGRGVIVIAVIIVVMKMFGGTSNAKEIVEKLKVFTTVDKIENRYEFTYDGMWTLRYTEESVSVTLPEPILSEYFEEVFGIGELGDDGTLKYNLETEDMNVYCDVEFEGEKLSVITYDVEKDEVTFIIDGERYELKKEYVKQFEDDDIASILKFDIKSFEDDLKKIDLTKDDVANLTYKDIKANLDDK
ncbi:zinc ribbon domain-containing protein [Faecalimonas sp.]